MKIFSVLTMLLFLSSCAIATGDTFTDGPTLLDPIAGLYETAVVERGAVIDTDMLFGMVRIISEPLYFEAEGFVFYEFVLDVGDEFRTGDVLAVLNTERVQDHLENLEANLTRLRRFHALEVERLLLAVDLLEMNYADTLRRSAETFDQDAADEAERIWESIEWARLNLTHARENQAQAISDALTSIRYHQSALMGTELTAPFDGVVTGLMSVLPGWPISAGQTIMYAARNGQTPFIEFVDDTTVWLERWLEENTRVHAQIGDRVYSIAHIVHTPEQRGDYARQVGTLRIPVRFAFTDISDEYPPVGAAVTIFRHLIHEEDVLRVPRQSLFSETPNGPHSVDIIVDGARMNVFVEVIAIGITYVAIESGIQEGDVVYVRP